MLVSDRPATLAGTFSRNKILSPSVTVTKDRYGAGAARGVVANSGCANCSVGEQGVADALEMTRLAEAHAGVAEGSMMVASTGMIGVELPMALLRQAIPTIELTDDGGPAFARSIMTTDTRAKHIAASFKAGGTTHHVGGAAKGVGMIHPDMATMLSFISCDAEIPADFLQESLSKAVDLSFNMIDVDGDQSTNDTVLLFANGAGGRFCDNGSRLRRRGGVPGGADGSLHLPRQGACRRWRGRGAHHGGNGGRGAVGRRRALRRAGDFVFQPGQGDGARQGPELGQNHDGARTRAASSLKSRR